jgi:hypothetical protein
VCGHVWPRRTWALRAAWAAAAAAAAAEIDMVGTAVTVRNSSSTLPTYAATLVPWRVKSCHEQQPANVPRDP